MESRCSRTDRCICAALVLLGLVAFWPSVWFDFVNWDDPSYVQHNELIRNWSPANLSGIATETVTRNYAPLTIFSFLVDHTLWGMNPSGYHATNVVLHLVNGVLVYLLLVRLSGSTFIAGMTAALFLVHPVQIESVAWISSRKGLLCAAFILAACLVRLRPEPGAKHDGWYIALLIAALLSKALAIMLPPIVFLYDVFMRRQKPSEAAVRQVIPAFFCALLLLHTMSAQNTVLGGVRGHMDLPLIRIIAVDITILWRYVGMLVDPTELCVLYDPPVSGIAEQVLLGGLVLVAIASGLWSWRKRLPLTVIAAATFLILLVPVLNFIPITTLMNDRYLYLPCIPVFAGIAWLTKGLVKLPRDVSHPMLGVASRAFCGVAASVAVAASLMVTSQHLPVWKDSFSLWTHAQELQPQIPVVRIQMALTLYDTGRVREAVNVLSDALRETNPDEGDRRRMQDAINAWQQELAAHRTAASAHQRLH